MSVYTHAAIGAAVGIVSGNPVLAFVLGMLSHAISDTISHFDFDSIWFEVALAVVGGVFLWWLGDWRLAVLCGILGAILPDMEHLLYYIRVFKKKTDLFPSHNDLVKHGRTIKPYSVLIQVSLFIFFAVWVWVAPKII